MTLALPTLSLADFRLPRLREAGYPPMPRLLVALLGLTALLAIAVPAIIVLTAPRAPPLPHVVLSKRVVPKTELPPVEPVKLQAVDATDAVAINEAIPFSAEPNIPARAFHLYGDAGSQARAVDCLAAAVYYEAGDDTVGEKAVAQVVLNRARHPAFPRSVCGVVFQGSERSTGCQFTFTCDGSMLRRSPSGGAWERARDVARLALNGSVDKEVGLATHYHTDWVVPYWSASLEKISAVKRNNGTHLFFRWAGWWGTPPAFNRGYGGVEPNIGLMARLSPNHHADAAMATLLPGAESTAIDPDAIPASAVPPSITGDANSFLVTLPKGMNSDSFASLAIRTCGERSYCKFMAWADGSKTPPALPLNSVQVATMSFSYLRDQNQGFAKALWNCTQYQRPSPVQCMRAQPLAKPLLPPVSAPAPQPDFDAKTPGPLSGVRRKAEAAPAGANPPAVKLTLPTVQPAPASTPAS
jgi:spore germination cell wall hydrolase CwlJ-like protein